MRRAAVRFGLVQGRLMPPPSRVFATLYQLAASGELLRDIVVTTARVAAGFYHVRDDRLDLVADLPGREDIEALVGGLGRCPSVCSGLLHPVGTQVWLSGLTQV